jgi:hypothetical protein
MLQVPHLAWWWCVKTYMASCDCAHRNSAGAQVGWQFRRGSAAGQLAACVAVWGGDGWRCDTQNPSPYVQACVRLLGFWLYRCQGFKLGGV